MELIRRDTHKMIESAGQSYDDQMIKSRPRAALWDMDGTLFDSTEYHWRSWRDTLADEGFILTYERFLKSFGRRTDASLRYFYGRDIPPDMLERIGNAKESLFRKYVREQGIDLLPGIAEWLNRLKRTGWRQAIASSAPSLNVEAILSVLNISGYFNSIITAEDVTTSKPDPRVFLEAAARLGVEPARCIVVEDVPAGIEGARRAGMRSIGAGPGYLSLPADLSIRTLAELPEDSFDRLVPA